MASIRLKTPISGPGINFRAGDVVEVGNGLDSDTCRRLVESGQAVAVEDQKTRTAATAPPRNTAKKSKAKGK